MIAEVGRNEIFSRWARDGDTGCDRMAEREERKAESRIGYR